MQSLITIFNIDNHKKQFLKWKHRQSNELGYEMEKKIIVEASFCFNFILSQFFILT